MRALFFHVNSRIRTSRHQASALHRLGFTLLELMIAVFILAVAAATLLGTQSTSVRMMSYSNNLAIVTMLARARMQDIEYQVLSEGFKTGYPEIMEGDFSDEGYPEIAWAASIEPIEIQDDAANNFVEEINRQLYGEGDEGGELSGNAAFSQFLPLMIGYMPVIINNLGQRIRRVYLELTWEHLGRTQSLTVSQYIVHVEQLPVEEVAGEAEELPEDGETGGAGLSDEGDQRAVEEK